MRQPIGCPPSVNGLHEVGFGRRPFHFDQENASTGMRPLGIAGAGAPNDLSRTASPPFGPSLSLTGLLFCHATAAITSLSIDLSPVAGVIAMRVDGDQRLAGDRALAHAAPGVDRVVAGREHRDIVRAGIGPAIFARARQRPARVRLAAIEVRADQAGQQLAIARSARTRRSARDRRRRRRFARPCPRAPRERPPGRAPPRPRRNRRGSRPRRERPIAARRRRARGETPIASVPRSSDITVFLSTCAKIGLNEALRQTSGGREAFRSAGGTCKTWRRAGSKGGPRPGRNA